MCRGRLPWLALLAVLAACASLGPASAARSRHAPRVGAGDGAGVGVGVGVGVDAGTGAGACGGAYPAYRDPANPLALSRPPGADPLAGANFFVDGPRHGSAAGAIATMLGINPHSFPDSYSWWRFKASLGYGRPGALMRANPGLASRVRLLEKIADQPEEQRFSLYSEGGGPGAVYAQVEKVLCHNLRADPGSIPIITTFFLYQAGYCESIGQILAHRARFERQVNEMVAAIGRHPAVMLLELDAIGSSGCMAGNGALPYWEADIRYEINAVASLPHTVIYVEGGYSDSSGPRYTARVLNAIGTSHLRGFFTNDTHSAWTISEIRWGNRVSRLTHLHFIVNTATNGRGPRLNPHPSWQGIEQLCNPPGRGMGPRPTTYTGFPMVDAFLWTGVPGNSSGSCNGGPASGTFWIARAIGLAARAQGKLGPRFATDPY